MTIPKFWTFAFWCDLFKRKTRPGPVKPAPVKPCGCSSESASFEGKGEAIFTEGPSGEVRFLINDEAGHGLGFDGRKAVTYDNGAGKTSVACIDLAPGIRAHYLGFRQPSSGSPMVTDNPTDRITSKGTLRFYFTSRKPQP